MKATELIQQLQKLVQENGDRDVVADFERYGHVEAVEQAFVVYDLDGGAVFELTAG